MAARQQDVIQFDWRWKLGISSPVVLKYSSQVTDHMSQVIVLPIQKVSQTLVKANLSPKNFCLGLRLAFASVWDTFCI